MRGELTIFGRSAGRRETAASGPRNPYFDPAKPHHTEYGFRNVDPQARMGGDFWRWQRERRRDGHPRAPEVGYDAFAREWSVTPDFSACASTRAQPRVWWLGHSTVLLKAGGLHVITDPVLSMRASPLPFAGPARKVPAVTQVAALPRIDVVLVSHNHYDHLDAATLRALAERNPQALFLAPLGLEAMLRRLGASRVHELDWWDLRSRDGVEFHCVPAQHWSARTPWDRNTTLWGGFVVRAPEFCFYFAGDTGYWSAVAEIPQRLGRIDLAALPIGAYAPRWFMRGQHIDPEEAVRIHREIGARRSLGIHWGTFELADDALDDPPRHLRRALLEAGLTEEQFWLLRQGEDRPL